MFAWFRKLFRKPKPLPRRPVAQERLIAWPLVNLGDRRRRRQLLQIDNLTPESRRMIENLEAMSPDEIRTPRKSWSDAV
jgi:hypothetical protein